MPRTDARSLRFARALSCLLLASASALFACSDAGELDGEITVRVFKSRGLDVGAVRVRAKQGPIEKSALLEDPFSSCERNLVRILPREGSDGGVPELTVSAEAEKGGHVARRTLRLGEESELVLVLGGAPDLEPGPCAGVDLDGALQQPDGGLADTQVPEQRATGEPCGGAAQCAGGECLGDFTLRGELRALPGGYCSQACETASTTSACAPGSKCASETNAFGDPIRAHCLKTCAAKTACREGYTCSEAGWCIVN